MTISRRKLFIAAIVLHGAFITTSGPATGQESHMGPKLIEAVRAGDTAEIERLIASGAPVDARDDAGRTALLVATHQNKADAARMLIAAGADVNAKDSIKDTPYLYAGAQGKNEILKMILETGKANLLDTNRYGGTALIPAAEKGHPETVRMLLRAGVAIDHVNNLGWTALLEAVMLADGGPVHQEIVKDLLDAGADWRIADNDGVTPLEHARRRGYAEIARMIEVKGAG